MTYRYNEYYTIQVGSRDTMIWCKTPNSGTICVKITGSLEEAREWCETAMEKI